MEWAALRDLSSLTSGVFKNRQGEWLKKRIRALCSWLFELTRLQNPIGEEGSIMQNDVNKSVMLS